MRKVFLLVLLLSFGPLFFWGCHEDYGYNDAEGPCGEDCPEVIPHFDIGGITTESLQNDTVTYLLYSLKVDLMPTFLGFNTPEKKGNNGLLFACSPAPCPMDGHEGTKTGLANIEVFTLTQYNETYLAGESINPMLEISTKMLDTDGNERTETISQYLARNNDAIWEYSFSLKLKSPPTTEGPHAFRIVYTLDDGRRFEAETEEVYLRP